MTRDQRYNLIARGSLILVFGTEAAVIVTMVLVHVFGVRF